MTCNSWYCIEGCICTEDEKRREEERMEDIEAENKNARLMHISAVVKELGRFERRF